MCKLRKKFLKIGGFFFKFYGGLQDLPQDFIITQVPRKVKQLCQHGFSVSDLVTFTVFWTSHWNISLRCRENNNKNLCMLWLKTCDPDWSLLKALTVRTMQVVLCKSAVDGELKTGNALLKLSSETFVTFSCSITGGFHKIRSGEVCFLPYSGSLCYFLNPVL